MTFNIICVLVILNIQFVAIIPVVLFCLMYNIVKNIFVFLFQESSQRCYLYPVKLW